MAPEPILAAPAVPVVRGDSLVSWRTLSDYWAMTKPEVNFLVAFTAATAFYLGSSATILEFPWMALLHAVAGTVLVASGAATLNQWAEHGFDARMHRTCRRPVAAGRVEPGRALGIGALLSLAGIAYLAIVFGALAPLLAAVTLLGYLVLYTPSKRRTPLCTLIGAVPGAMPPLIGWAASRGRLDPEAWVLYAIVFLWQFPHFMAIAWMYQDDYDRAGYHILPHGRSRGHLATLQTLLPLLALMPLTLLPILAGGANLLYFVAALLLGLGFVHSGARFSLRKSGPSARNLLVASVIYLPALFVLMIVARG